MDADVIGHGKANVTRIGVVRIKSNKATVNCDVSNDGYARKHRASLEGTALTVDQ